MRVVERFASLRPSRPRSFAEHSILRRWLRLRDCGPIRLGRRTAGGGCPHMSRVIWPDVVRDRGWPPSIFRKSPKRRGEPKLAFCVHALCEKTLHAFGCRKGTTSEARFAERSQVSACRATPRSAPREFAFRIPCLLLPSICACLPRERLSHSSIEG